MGGRGGGSSVRSPIVVAQQSLADQNALADLDIRDAFEDATNASGQSSEWVSIQRIRTALTTRGWSRERQDEQLRRFVRERKAVAVPESEQASMTQSYRNSALRIGGQDKHVMALS